MSCLRRPSDHSRRQGFSLIEMLVALMFIGILSAGMMRVYASNLAAFQRTNDSISNQRRGQWALNQLSDDVASMGYFALTPFNTPDAFVVNSGAQEPLMILPSPTAVKITGPDPSNPGGAGVTTTLSPSPDELQYVSDIPLPIEATLTGFTGTTVTANVTLGSLSDVNVSPTNDNSYYMVILDGTYPGSLQQFRITGVSGNVITIDSTVYGTEGSQVAGGYTLSPAVLTHSTSANIPLAFFRRSIVTRYSIQAQAWDPANVNNTVPCLVRQRAPYIPGGALIDWTDLKAAPLEIVADNIIGFTVNISFDGGANWERTGAASWGDIVSNINSRLTTTLAVTTIAPVRNAAYPLWFRSFPALMRIDVTSRSSTPRSENSQVTGQAAYVTRTQTVMVAPRNFGLPLN